MAVVRLGFTTEGSIAASIAALVERGAMLRPHLLGGLDGEVELRFHEGYPPVRVRFDDEHLLVEDGPCAAPDLIVSGALPDIVRLTTLPPRHGIPRAAALRLIASGRVTLKGDRVLGWRLLSLLAVDS